MLNRTGRDVLLAEIAERGFVKTVGLPADKVETVFGLFVGTAHLGSLLIKKNRGCNCIREFFQKLLILVKLNIEVYCAIPVELHGIAPFVVEVTDTHFLLRILVVWSYCTVISVLVGEALPGNLITVPVKVQRTVSASEDGIEVTHKSGLQIGGVYMGLNFCHKLCCFISSFVSNPRSIAATGRSFIASNCFLPGNSIAGYVLKSVELVLLLLLIPFILRSH